MAPRRTETEIAAFAVISEYKKKGGDAMNCEKFRECLDNYENLTNEEKAEMTLHAAQCEECASELDFLLSIIETTKSLPVIEPPSDFMDRLNVRIDAEERKKQQIAMRILRNMQRNWRQYVAAAACFALVAVITANGKLLLGKIDSEDDGVIIEETVTTGNSDTSAATTPTVSAAPQISDVKADEPETADSASSFEEAAVPAVKKASADKKANTQTAPKASVSAATVKPSAQTAKTSENTASPTVEDSSAVQIVNTEAAEKVSEVATATLSIHTAQAEPKIDYGIAAASITPEVEVSAYSAEADNYTAMSARRAYSLADEDNNIALGKYYNTDNGDDNDDDEPKAIGKLKISSADAQKAINVINQYSFDQDGDLYTTDSANLTLILSSLNREDVSYTDYTMESDGVVKFKVVFN